MYHIVVIQTPLVGLPLVIVTSTLVNHFRRMCNVDWQFCLYYALEPDKRCLPVPCDYVLGCSHML